MEAFSALALIAMTYLLALMVPGPNLLLIAQLSLTGQRRAALTTALGIASGSIVWAAAAMAGVASLLSRHETALLALRWAGVLYLLWFAVKLWRSRADGPLPYASSQGDVDRASLKDLVSGFTTSASNPKSAFFWTSVFASAFPSTPPGWFYGATLLVVATLALGVYAGVAAALARPRGILVSGRRHRTIRRLCAALLVVLGGLLGLDAYRSTVKA